MPNWWKNFSWERLFDAIADRSPTFVKIIIVTGKSFLYYHGMTRAASLTYTTLVAVVPLLILLTSITLAVGLANFMSDYLPILLDILNLDWPTEPIMALVRNAEHIPIGRLGFIGAAGLFVTFILAFGSLETNFNVVWENKISRTLIRQIEVYTPFLVIFAGFIGMFAGFVNHVQDVLNMIVVEGFHFSPEVLKVLPRRHHAADFPDALRPALQAQGCEALFPQPASARLASVYGCFLGGHQYLRENPDAHPDRHGDPHVHFLRVAGVFALDAVPDIWSLVHYPLRKQPGVDHLPLARSSPEDLELEGYARRCP